MTQFTRSPFTIKEIAEGSAHIWWDIEGFWTDDTITLHVERHNGKWTFDLGSSSGGHTEGFDPIVRARNFAAAMNDAADTIEFLKSVEDQLEIGFHEHQEKVSKEFMAQFAEA